MSRAEMLQQLKRATVQVHSGLERTDADDHLAFAELASSYREMAELADKLAATEVSS